jgi:hypothetical protein
VRETRTLRVMWRELETGPTEILRATAPVPDPTRNTTSPPKVRRKESISEMWVGSSLRVIRRLRQAKLFVAASNSLLPLEQKRTMREQ